MKRLVLLLALIPAAASAQNYVMPRIPSEAEKVEALKIGYILNGFSMDGHMGGSIDITKAMPAPPAPGAVRDIPLTPPKKGRDK